MHPAAYKHRANILKVSKFRTILLQRKIVYNLTHNDKISVTMSLFFSPYVH